MSEHEIRPGVRRSMNRSTRVGRDAEADDEIRLHLQLRIAQLIDEGMSPEAARAEAEKRFGEIEAERRRFRAVDRRRDWRERMRDVRDALRQDTRYAFRTLRRDSSFTLFAILIIGLGIGACATVFSLVDGVLLRPLPMKNPSRLVWVWNVGNDNSEWRLQSGSFVGVGERSHTMSGIAGYDAYYTKGNAVLGDTTSAERLTRVPVTCNFLPLLGVSPALGRPFNDAECQENAGQTTILTDAMWRRQFSADPGVVGRTITINGAPTTVIGVLPAAFDFTSVFAPGTSIDMLVPFSLGDQNNSRGNTLAVVGRLTPGASASAADAELSSISKQLTAEFPRRNPVTARAMALSERINGRVKPALSLLIGTVAAVMLIVIANLTSLQYARLSSRRREIAVRLALGAGRARIAGQTLTESLMLAGAGAMLGVIVTVVGTRVVAHLSAFDIPLLSRVQVNGTALAVAAGLALLTGAVIGLLPALGAPRDVNDALKEGHRGSTRGGQARVRTVLVVAEIALASVLLVASGLLVRSFVHVLDLDLGYRPEQLASLRVDPVTQFTDRPTANAYYDAVLRNTRAIPGVTQASLADVLPFAGDRSWSVRAEGKVYDRDHIPPDAAVRVVADGYFRTMGIPMRTGSDFVAADASDTTMVAVINASLAHTLWADRDPLGQTLNAGGRRFRVVGVVGDVRHGALEKDFTGEFYLSVHQIRASTTYLVVRSSMSQSALAAAVRTALSAVAPNASKGQWQTLQSFVDRASSPRRFVVLLLGGFSVFALLLAALGIYALVAYGVSQRLHEIGIRMALGASSAVIRRDVIVSTLRMAIGGIAIGIVAAAITVRGMSGMLFGVSWADPASFGGALVVLAIVAVVAGYVPARRASLVDPSTTLRE